eukprot:673090-Pyramimonas_sp.AAC.1
MVYDCIKGLPFFSQETTCTTTAAGTQANKECDSIEESRKIYKIYIAASELRPPHHFTVI